MSRSLELQKLFKKKKGKFSSEYRDPIKNEEVYKKLGYPTNETSFHQILGGGGDKLVKTKKEADELTKELRKNNFYSYNKKTNSGEWMVHGDIGPYAEGNKRKEEFDKLYNQQLSAKAAYLFGSPNTENISTKDRIPNTQDIKREPQSMNDDNSQVPWRPDVSPEEIEKFKKLQEMQMQQEVQNAEQTMEGATTIATDESVKEKIKEAAKELPHQEQKKIKDDLTSGNKVLENVSNAVNKKSSGQEPSVRESFFEAMSFFLPNIVGLVAGSAIAGTEGAIAGEEKAGQLASGFREYKLKKDQIEKTKVKDIDVTSFTDSSSGKPVRYNPADGSFTDIEGNQISKENIVQTNVYKQGRSLKQQQQESVRKADQFAKKYDLDKAKLGQLADKQVEELGSLSDTEASIDRIRIIKNKVNTGPLASQLQAGAKLVDLAPDKFVELQTEVGSMVNNYIKAITGAQMSEPEAERIKSVAPDINDDDNTFMVKLNAFERIVSSRKNVIAAAIASGQPLRKDVVRQMVKEAEEVLAKLPKQEGKKSSNVLRRRTKDGRIAIFDEKTKKFLRYE